MTSSRGNRRLGTEPPLQGRVALVTGGSRGIGRGIAEHLLGSGASVVMTSTSAEGDTVAEQLSDRYGAAVAHLHGDVRDRTCVRGWVSGRYRVDELLLRRIAHHVVQRREGRHARAGPQCRS